MLRWGPHSGWLPRTFDNADIVSVLFFLPLAISAGISWRRHKFWLFLFQLVFGWPAISRKNFLTRIGWNVELDRNSGQVFMPIRMKTVFSYIYISLKGNDEKNWQQNETISIQLSWMKSNQHSQAMWCRTWNPWIHGIHPTYLLEHVLKWFPVGTENRLVLMNVSFGL